MSVIEWRVTGHEGGRYEVTFWEGRRFTVDRADTYEMLFTPHLREGLMTFCGIPLPIGWVERRIKRIIAHEERKRARLQAREAAIKARWADDLPRGRARYWEVFGGD